MSTLLDAASCAPPPGSSTDDHVLSSHPLSIWNCYRGPLFFVTVTSALHSWPRFLLLTANGCIINALGHEDSS